jgi:hypothetical protein
MNLQRFFKALKFKSGFVLLTGLTENRQISLRIISCFSICRKFLFRGCHFQLFEGLIDFYLLRLDVFGSLQTRVSDGPLLLTLREKVAGLFSVAIVEFIST